MKLNLLEIKINQIGIKRKKIAEDLGLSEHGFRLKRQGKNEFKAGEIAYLRKKLKLSAKEEKEIFFYNSTT